MGGGVGKLNRSEFQMSLVDLPVSDTAIKSEKTFSDGGQFRIEIPSTEGPRAMKELLREAEALDCPVHRVSQGSGIQMLSDEDIRHMARLGAEQKIEVCLFVTPRASFETGGLWNASQGRVVQWQNRGAEQLRFCLDDINRALDLGIRSFLLADFGLIDTVGRLRGEGNLPENLQIKTSAVMAPANPASVRFLQALGASTVNVATDLDVAKLSSIRQAVDIPLDIYVEAPDGLGGYVRHHEAPAMVEYVAPIYIKLGLRNSPDIYPSGIHLDPTVIHLSRERVRRSRLVLDLIRRELPEAVMSPVGTIEQLGIPEI